MADIDDFTRFFPYEDPFENQAEAMDRIYNALVRGQDVLFEGACGTGKTLASLAPSLSFARENDKTVIITTNVNQQARQFRREAAAISQQEPIQAVVFRGKGSMCHIDVDYEECQVLRDNTYELVDAEQSKHELQQQHEHLQSQTQQTNSQADKAQSAVLEELNELNEQIEELENRATCDYYYQNLREHNDEFYQWLFDGVRSPEEIYQYAEEAGLCGYELLKDGLENVDLVVCNYHHLLDSTIREQFFRWLDVDPNDVIVIFDEAHNIADTARDHARVTLSERTLERAIDELDTVDDSRVESARNIFSAFLEALRSTYDQRLGFGERGTIGDAWKDITITNEDKRDDLTLAFFNEYTGSGIQSDLSEALELGEQLDQTYETAYREGDANTRQECPTLNSAQFIQQWMNTTTDTGKYPVLSLRRDAGSEEIYGRAEIYTCIPSDVTGDLFSETYSTVLMSATLQPFDVTEDVLGLDSPVAMVYELPFPRDNRETFAVSTPPLFSNQRDDDSVQNAIYSALSDAITFIPGNILVFFPNYTEANRYYEMLSGDTDASLYLDEPGMNATTIRDEFTDASNGVLFTSLWGTLTEGVSFDGDDAVAVIVVGVPYPHLDDRAQAVQDAYDSTFADRAVDNPGWRYAVEIPTIRKTRQALGRVIRSPSDIGTRILLDNRYTSDGVYELGDYSVHETLPKHLRDELIDVDPDKLRYALLNFYQGHNAYDGNPPRP